MFVFVPDITRTDVELSISEQSLYSKLLIIAAAIVLADKHVYPATREAERAEFISNYLK